MKIDGMELQPGDIFSTPAGHVNLLVEVVINKWEDRMLVKFVDDRKEFFIHPEHAVGCICVSSKWWQE